MQPIAGNRGCESRRWYQEQVMHAGEQQWKSKTLKFLGETREKIRKKCKTNEEEIQNVPGQNMIVCNRGCESRRCYQDPVMYRGEQPSVSRNMEKDSVVLVGDNGKGV